MKKLRKIRFSALQELGRHFPVVNVEPLERIKDLYHHPEKPDRLYRNPDEIMNVWNCVVKFFGEVIREDVHKISTSRRKLSVYRSN